SLDAPDAGTAPGALGAPSSWRACRERLEALRKLPSLPGAPAFEAERLQMVGRVRGAALLWKREPKRDELSPKLTETLAELESATEPLQLVRALIRKKRRKPAELRAMLLREGYLYLRGVEPALAVVQQLGLHHLFRAEELFLLRDGSVQRLTRGRHRGRTRYEHGDGPLAGERAEILFGDRVGTEQSALTVQPAAVDFDAARTTWGFERLRNVHLTAEGMAAEVRYGAEVWTPALFDVAGPAARLVCHGLEAATAARVQAAQDQAVRTAKVFARVRTAVERQVREQLPFDAPRGGGGDPADKYPLRGRWRDAYDRSMRSFRFADRTYEVYDERGRPLVPQVCIDFVYDTWERAGGTWYAPLSRARDDAPLRPAPERTIGTVDLDGWDLSQRRRVSKFLDFAAGRADLFDLWQTPPEDQAVFADHPRFFAVLAKHADRFRPGDVLVVRRVRSEGRALHHNLIVLETDLSTGIPVLLVGNAARPRIQTFDGVMQINPRRYLQYRIRPKPGWFDEALLRADAEGLAVP
ncbi:MAG: hypothetical protein JRI23_27880, partial [Deltaproteobacteria bacterium]|nr:hypothetical protein [Deltaproteobacteria bacterium]MBW2535911.1 hypothetical protein [Deltaproteobacteria bacterium]